ncbi:FAD linked oxidase domain protein [Deinococcus aerius]|uniref:FAD linked oxidase domain protein n=1 Tax=Deinococcus aerius TaxID=200253 RepID=A0A2I9DNT0_9DEIO|nr:FAD-dependent oxidoreductase [Deinococcus aerius]GBF06761.1 FAD linked oxidase domain protein [Deinococcus aerius]
MTHPSPAALLELRLSLAGRALSSEQPEYEVRRPVWNAQVDAHPALIVQPQDAGDVARTLRFARGQRLPVAVRSGGHSPAGFGTVERGVVIDLSGMRGIEIDPDTRRVRLEPGLTWGEVARALEPHGLAITAGDVPTVGVGGLTQGGGIGWFVRKHGLNIDRLRAVELVTADGQFLRASATERPELFWGLRGGGANFGVVTAYEFEAHEGGTVLGGLVMYPVRDAAHARQLLSEYARIAGSAPDDLSTQGLLVAAPPLPFIPEELVGKPLVVVSLCYSGDLTEGERVVSPLRTLAEPLLDTVAPMPYSGLLEMPPYGQAGDHGFHHALRAAFLKELPEEFFGALTDSALGAGHPGMLIQLRMLGGEMSRVPASSAAFAHRDKAAILMISHITPVGAPPEVEAWGQRATEAVFAAVRPLASGTYGNFLSVGEEDRVREVFPGSTHARLAALKAEYDPENVFARNANVKPVRATAAVTPA